MSHTLMPTQPAREPQAPVRVSDFERLAAAFGGQPVEQRNSRPAEAPEKADTPQGVAA